MSLAGLLRLGLLDGRIDGSGTAAVSRDFVGMVDHWDNFVRKLCNRGGVMGGKFR